MRWNFLVLLVQKVTYNKTVVTICYNKALVLVRGVCVCVCENDSSQTYRHQFQHIHVIWHVPWDQI
jgi:hypothetical protein